MNIFIYIYKYKYKESYKKKENGERRWCDAPARAASFCGVDSALATYRWYRATLRYPLCTDGHCQPRVEWTTCHASCRSPIALIQQRDFGILMNGINHLNAAIKSIGHRTASYFWIILSLMAALWVKTSGGRIAYWLETSDWQDSTDRVSSWSWVRISQRAGQTTGPTSSDVCSWMACVWLLWLLLAWWRRRGCICMFISGCDDSDMNGSDPNCCSSSSEWSKRVAFITLIGGGSWKPGDPPTTPSPRGLLDHNPINSNLWVIHHLSTIQPISKYCDKTVDQINPSSLHQRHLSGGLLFIYNNNNYYYHFLYLESADCGSWRYYLAHNSISSWAWWWLSLLFHLEATDDSKLNWLPLNSSHSCSWSHYGGMAEPAPSSCHSATLVPVINISK